MKTLYACTIIIIFLVPYVYVGCYVDDIERVLGDDHKDNQEMSANICYGICTKSQKWKEGDHFGTQYAKECSCGDGKQLGYNPYFERNISECYHDCLGHKEEKCGGNYRMSVYRITKRDNNYSCLDMDQKRTIKDCATNHLQEESLCIKFDASSENQNQRCSGIGNKLYDFCRREHLNRKCVFNMKNVLKATNENQPSRSISIEYLCKERASIPTESSLTTAAIPMYPIIVAVLVVAIIAALVFIIVVFYRKRKKAMNSQPCEIQQNQINTDNVYFSNSNIEHYTEITRNSIPIVYENINDNKTISCEPQKIANFQQKGNNYESLSSNRNSSVHMYEFTKCVSKEKDLSQYQSLTNPPASDIHTYESTELDLSQYQSLDNPSEKDIHTYASTTTIQ